MFPLLDIQNLQIDFVTENGTVTALHQVNLTVNRNEIVGIAGESGSGKSVTALAILQLLSSASVRYRSGHILFSPDGATQSDILHAGINIMRNIRGKQIGMIFQEPMTSLNPVFTCGHQVMEALLLHNDVSAEEARKRTISLFTKVRLPDPENIINRYPHQLSGGQRQRVMIAMAISGNPSLLICDEPTTALDVTVQKTVLELLKELQHETGMGVIFISHDLAVIAEIASRVVIMHKGRIAEEGMVQKVFTTPRDPYTKALLACRPVLYRKGTRLPVVSDFINPEQTSAKHETTYTELTVKDSRNAEHTESAEKIQLTGKEALISVKNLSVWYPAKKTFFGKPLSYNKAVDGVTFDVFRGETLGLVGESGCGKTTLGRTLLRLIEPTSGDIYFEGSDFRQLSCDRLRKFRRNIQIIFQDPYSSLNPSIPIGSAIGEPIRVHQPQLSVNTRRAKVAELLEKVGLNASHMHRYPHEFSGGQRQRIVIARALALEPSFIVCDESVSALDVSVQAQVLNLLNDLKHEFRFTSIFISHDLSVVRYMCDRIMVMKQGRIVETGNADQIYRDPASAYTRTLLEAVPHLASGSEEKSGF